MALTIGITLGLTFTLRAAGVSYPATLAAVVGGLGMGIGGPKLSRWLRQIMLANRARSPR
jgi:xanthosine utilization system XapX-like protein